MISVKRTFLLQNSISSGFSVSAYSNSGRDSGHEPTSAFDPSRVKNACLFFVRRTYGF